MAYHNTLYMESFYVHPSDQPLNILNNNYFLIYLLFSLKEVGILDIFTYNTSFGVPPVKPCKYLNGYTI